MKRLLNTLFLSIVLTVGLFAQCTTANQSIVETFPVDPPCWTTYSLSCGLTAAGEMQICYGNNFPMIIVLPKVVNAKGILTFTARRLSAFQAPSLQIGAMASAANTGSFTPISAVFSISNTTNQTYTFDLSSYTGNYQFIAIRSTSSVPTRRANLDNLTYNSACVSTAVTAIAQDITLQLGGNGSATLTPQQINNGSTNSCGVPANVSIDIANFNCNDIGVRQVVLTARDNLNNISRDTANVTIVEAINDEVLTVPNSALCAGTSATITTASSVNGVKYYLRNDADNSIIQGPITGTGSSLTFNSGILSGPSTFNVFAETSSPSNAEHAVRLDGTDDYVDLGANNRGITNTITISARVRLSATGADEIIASKMNSSYKGFDLYVSRNGKAAISGNDAATGPTKTSGESSTVITDNQWHEITGVVTSTAWQIYIDGILEASATYTPGTNGLTCTDNFFVGRELNLYGQAEVDYLSVWNVGMTPIQVLQNYGRCLNGNEPNLVGLYLFDESNGSTTRDYSSSALNGTLTNMNTATSWVTGAPNACPVCSREMSQTVTFTVGDATAPLPNVTTLPNVTAQCSVNSLTAPVATDNCAGTITATHNATLPIMSNTTITWTYNDGNGNTSTQQQQVLVNDNTPPVANTQTLPNITAQCSVNSLTAPIATDNCAGAITGTHNATLPITSSTTVTWTYNDGNGNTSTQQQQVLVNDNIAPIANQASLPALSANCEITSLTAPIATDNCVGTVTGTHNGTLPFTTSQTITWTYSDGHGNASSQTQSVIITPISTGISVIGQALIANQSGASYQWIDCSNLNAPIPGAIAQSFTPLVSGSYAVVISLNNCTVTSSCVNHTVVGLAQANLVKCAIAPNPAIDRIEILTDENVHSVLIYNVLGELVAIHESASLSVSSLPSGLYFLQIATDKGMMSGSFIKE